MFLAEHSSVPMAFTITPQINAYSTDARSIHHTIQQLRGGTLASDDIISSFKDELKRMRQDLEKEANMELRATRAELRQKLGNMFDHDDDTSAVMTDDDDEYEYVEEEIDIDVESDNDYPDDDLHAMEEEIDVDVKLDSDDPDDDLHAMKGEANEDSFPTEDGDDDEENAAEDEHGYGYAGHNQEDRLDTGRYAIEEDPSEELSKGIIDRTKVELEQTSEILPDDPLEIQKDDNLQDVHEKIEEELGNIEDKLDLDENTIEIGESEEIDGNAEMLEEVETVKAKPTKDKVKVKKKKPKAKKKKKKQTPWVEVEEDNVKVADRIAQEIAFKTPTKSESSLGNIVSALIPTILVLLLIVISHFGFELLLKKISPSGSS